MREHFRESLARVRGAEGNPVAYTLKSLFLIPLCFGYLCFGRDFWAVSLPLILAVCLAMELIYALPPVESTLCVAALALIFWLPARAWSKLAAAREREWEGYEETEDAE
jgi:hypothetical protein